MRTPLRAAALIVSVSVPTGMAHAQTFLTEADAVARLSPESARVRALRAEIDLAKSEAALARRFPNPRVTLSREAVAGQVESFLLVSQPLPITGRRRLDARAADARVRAVELRVADLERLARRDLRLAFATLRAEQVQEADLTATAREVRELAAVLAERERAGDAAGFDRLRAEREALDLEAQLGQTSTHRMQAQADLAAFFSPGTDPLTLTVADDAVAPPPLPALDDLLRQAARRGNLLALEADVEAARLAGRSAARRNVPEPEIVAGVKTFNVGGGVRGGVVSVSAALPLFDRSRPERARAEARERQAAATLDLRRAEIEAQVTVLRAIVAARSLAVEGYRADALGGADALRRIAQVSYDAGERGIFELLDAYRSSLAARLRMVDLEHDRARAEIDLEFLSGWEGVR